MSDALNDKPTKPLDKIIRDDGRYPPEAFEFLHAGLNRAVKSIHGPKVAQDAAEPPQRHVTGRQICMGLRDLAIERWGMLARVVLGSWNIRKTMDFGNMVYLLIQNNFWRKTEDDSMDDFRDVYDFDVAFDSIDHFELSE